MANDLEAIFVGILGTTGCGKTTELKKRLAKKKRSRTFIWSPKEPLDNYAALYAGSVVVRKASEVLDLLAKAGKRGSFHIVFQPTLDQGRDMALFDVVCKMLLAAGNLTFVVDELHSVTQPGNAPHGWRKINFMGRGYGIEVFGLSQRPASVDKAFMGALSFIHVGRLPHPPDQKSCAEVLGVDRAEVAALSGYQAIQKDMQTGKITRIK